MLLYIVYKEWGSLRSPYSLFTANFTSVCTVAQKCTYFNFDSSAYFSSDFDCYSDFDFDFPILIVIQISIVILILILIVIPDFDFDCYSDFDF